MSITALFYILQTLKLFIKIENKQMKIMSISLCKDHLIPDLRPYAPTFTWMMTQWSVERKGRADRNPEKRQGA